MEVYAKLQLQEETTNLTQFTTDDISTYAETTTNIESSSTPVSITTTENTTTASLLPGKL